MRWADLLPGDLVVRLPPSQFCCSWTILYKTKTDIGTLMIDIEGSIKYPVWEHALENGNEIPHEEYAVVRNGKVIKSDRKLPFTW